MRFDLQLVKRGRNLYLIGWNAGYVMVQFRGRPDRYIYGPAIPESEVVKIMNNPFPDRLFTFVIKNKYKSCKV